MIYVANFNDRRIRNDIWDEKWAIVRSYKHPSTAFKQVAVLSPSFDLFLKYRNMAEKHVWCKETFEKDYIPVFLKEMHQPDAVHMLNQLYSMSKTKNIALVCFCKEEDLCHRSIIAGLLQGAGASVQTSSGKDYSEYWQMYNNPDVWQNV